MSFGKHSLLLFTKISFRYIPFSFIYNRAFDPSTSLLYLEISALSQLTVIKVFLFIVSRLFSISST